MSPAQGLFLALMVGIALAVALAPSIVRLLQKATEGGADA